MSKGPRAYYNENDLRTVLWLKDLIRSGQVADGDVDDRSLVDVTPNDLRGYTQHHFFAGIGVWSYALRQAGWPDTRPVWTGSCPCQPFSTAGKGAGFADERHLWPAFHWLIEQCRPLTVFGEQVAGKAGETWFDLVSNDLENSAYTVGAAVTAACGFGAPHQRKRLYWVADCQHDERQGCISGRGVDPEAERSGTPTESPGHHTLGVVADSGSPGPQKQRGGRNKSERLAENGVPNHPGPVNGRWSGADWLFCRDGKWRPVEPGTFPLVNGATNRVVKLRGYGNAIVVDQAQAFIEAVMQYNHLAGLSSWREEMR